MAAWRGAIWRSLMMAALALALAPGKALPQETSAHRLPPRPPADPAASAVYAVLERHCARCHQDGRLERPAPAAAFGNILRLDELAATPSLVQPGNPDASRLYVMMLRRLMPLAPSTQDATPALPTSDEIAHVRSWISGLPPRGQCRDRPPVTLADHAATLTQLRTVTGEDPKKLRFLSIAHLHNGCVRGAALPVYRQAVVQIFNSLSWKSAPVAVPPVDPARTLFKINLDDLGWLPEHWERIMRSGGHPLGLTAPLPSDVREAYGTEFPVARADWFAKTVLSAPLYYDVLGLPGTGSEILKLLHGLRLSPAAGDLAGQSLRGMVPSSSFAISPSLIERHQSHSGPVWQAYHWNAEDQIPQLPPESPPAPESIAPPYHAARGMFTLPNGLPGFFLIGQRGDRLDTLPPGIAKPVASVSSPIAGGLDCMACHRRGPLPVAGRADPSLTPSVAHALAADGKAISDAMRRIGIDPELTLDGVAPVVALAKEYARPLDASRAAAELGIDLASLKALADRGADPASVLARRLVQGLVARAEIESRANALATAVQRPRVTDASASIQADSTDGAFTPIDPGPGLILYSDKAHYRRGDNLQITVRVASDCHLTVVSIDTQGRGTVLFPSDFDASSLITAGQELKLPSPGAPYKLRLNEAGRETIVALCNEAGGLTDNIRYDFERQRFTELGDYATFLLQNALIDPHQAAAVPPSSPPRRGRRRSPAEATPEVRAKPNQISRTAISIVVE